MADDFLRSNETMSLQFKRTVPTRNASRKEPASKRVPKDKPVSTSAKGKAPARFQSEEPVTSYSSDEDQCPEDIDDDIVEISSPRTTRPAARPTVSYEPSVEIIDFDVATAFRKPPAEPAKPAADVPETLHRKLVALREQVC